MLEYQRLDNGERNAALGERDAEVLRQRRDLGGTGKQLFVRSAIELAKAVWF